VATCRPSGAFSWVERAWPLSAGLEVADDAGEPLTTAGVVPGWVLACWGELQALIATIGNDNRAVTAMFLLMPAA
jgi:hypothetical protein